RVQNGARGQRGSPAERPGVLAGRRPEVDDLQVTHALSPPRLRGPPRPPHPPFTAPPSLVARSSLLSPGGAAPLQLAHGAYSSSGSRCTSPTLTTRRGSVRDR